MNLILMIATSLMILWILAKNVSFRAARLARAAASGGAAEPEAAVAAGGYDRDSQRETRASAAHFALEDADGDDDGPAQLISDEELASAKAESAAKNDVWNAAAESDFRFMHLWLEASLPLDPLDEKQQTPLMAAAREGGTYMCALLISRGGDVNLQDRDGWTALHFAADGGHEKVVELLANRDANLDAQAATNGWTALHIAAFYDRRVLANVLLDCGASVGVKSTDGKTALALANERGSNRFLAAVADKGKDDRSRGAAPGHGRGRFHVKV